MTVRLVRCTLVISTSASTDKPIFVFFFFLSNDLVLSVDSSRQRHRLRAKISQGKSDLSKLVSDYNELSTTLFPVDYDDALLHKFPWEIPDANTRKYVLCLNLGSLIMVCVILIKIFSFHSRQTLTIAVMHPHFSVKMLKLLSSFLEC